jgi:hypothetical protein
MGIIASRFANFNNVSLNTVPNLQVYSIDPPGKVGRKLNISVLARRSGRKMTSAFYNQRQVNLGVYITCATREALDAALDILYGLIQANEGQLVIPQSGTVRAYTATFFTSIINNDGGEPQGGYIDLTLVFECSDSYGYDTNYSTIFQQNGVTAGTITTPYTQGGSAKEQVPFIQVQYTALTGATAGQVSIINPATGQTLQTVARVWSQYDLLQVDFQKNTVQVNNLDVDFTGPMIEWGKGAQSIVVTDNFTTRTANHIWYVYNRWV